ncbi:MAG: GNAT family N-acetyltransferase [Pseudomonadales bacterium]|nr:GNAT family N-acetyltransferase [Pseudomonadales bacterium]
MTPEITIRNYRATDAREITDLFHDSIHDLAKSQYSRDQLEAWCPTPPDYAHWQTRLNIIKPFVAVCQAQNGKIAGFIELVKPDEIDCLYVHPLFARQGIAKQLYRHLENQARQQQMKQLLVEASLLARPLFEQVGFSEIRRNEIPRNGEVLVNFSMIKPLTEHNHI